MPARIPSDSSLKLWLDAWRRSVKNCRASSKRAFFSKNSSFKLVNIDSSVKWIPRSSTPSLKSVKSSVVLVVTFWARSKFSLKLVKNSFAFPSEKRAAESLWLHSTIVDNLSQSVFVPLNRGPKTFFASSSSAKAFSSTLKRAKFRSCSDNASCFLKVCGSCKSSRTFFFACLYSEENILFSQEFPLSRLLAIFSSSCDLSSFSIFKFFAMSCSRLLIFEFLFFAFSKHWGASFKECSGWAWMDRSAGASSKTLTIPLRKSLSPIFWKWTDENPSISVIRCSSSYNTSETGWTTILYFSWSSLAENSPRPFVFSFSIRESKSFRQSTDGKSSPRISSASFFKSLYSWTLSAMSETSTKFFLSSSFSKISNGSVSGGGATSFSLIAESLSALAREGVSRNVLFFMNSL